MWFPDNKPATRGNVATGTKPQLNNNTTPADPVRRAHVVTTRFPTPTPQGCGGCGARVTAVIAWGKRPVPSRTRKLRPTAPMVLHPGGCGRVGHRRNTINGRGPPTQVGGPPAFNRHAAAGHLAARHRQDRRPEPWATPRAGTTTRQDAPPPARPPPEASSPPETGTATQTGHRRRPPTPGEPRRRNDPAAGHHKNTTQLETPPTPLGVLRRRPPL